jgi:outer membrane lipoprotein-sorting protein
VQDYSVVLDITADMERMTIPPMQVRMYYKQPDKFHFESESFAMLPREGLAFSASRVLSRFTVEGVTEQMSPQGKQFELLLRPKDERARSTKLVLTIDGTNWKPMKIVSSLFDGRTMTAAFQYEKQNDYLMPSLLTVQFTSSSADTTEQAMGMEEVAPVHRPQMPRKGTITIRYSEYKINTGLSDDIFDMKK